MKDILIKQFFSKLGIQYSIENINLTNEFAYEYIKKITTNKHKEDRLTKQVNLDEDFTEALNELFVSKTKQNKYQEEIEMIDKENELTKSEMNKIRSCPTHNIKNLSHLEWCKWCDSQIAKGNKQTQCPECGKWLFQCEF